MKLKHEKNLQKPQKEDISFSGRINSVCISPSLDRLAVGIDGANHLILYDIESGQARDKFATKSNNANFYITGLVFSPDSEKIAISQNEGAVHVYRIGSKWNEKKSIVQKFNLPSAAVQMLWTPLGIVYGSIDGKVKLINVTTNKMSSVISSSSPNVTCVSLAFSPPNQVVAGFYNGTIMFNQLISKESSSKAVLTHSCAPFALTLTLTGYVACGGSDGRITFEELNQSYASNVSSRNSSAYTLNSASTAHSRMASGYSTSTASSKTQRQTIDWGNDISSAVSSPSGTIIIFSSLDNLLVFELEQRVWRHRLTVNIEHGLLINGMNWSVDGTRLAVSSINGSLDVFRCRWKTKLIGSRFEINFVGPRQIVILDQEERTTSMFSSSNDIKDVKILRERYVVIWTVSSLILGSLHDKNLRSEIEWNGLNTSQVKFSFDYDNVAMIAAMGELFLVELGQNRTLGSVRTDWISPHLLSVRLNERKSSSKVFAYLLDVKTICVVDLKTGLQISTWSHNERLDWLEMNETGNRLIYRDKALKLIYVDIVSQEFRTLLNFCGFVQWVPGSDVIVAQSRDKLYVWYDVRKPVIYNIIGGEANEALEIERRDGKTLVIFSKPDTEIELDEVVLEFDTAIDDGDLERAENFLEILQDSSKDNMDTQSMWLKLGNIALKATNLSVAQRCFAAVGDIAKVNFIEHCISQPEMLPLLDADYERFENGDFDYVLATYLKTYNWNKAIDFVKKNGRIDLVNEIEDKQFEWLLETGQSSMAAQIAEQSNNIEKAIQLYSASGRMLQVTKLIMKHQDEDIIDESLIRKVIQDLKKAESYEEMAELYSMEKINDKKSALKFFIQGKAFNKALQLAKTDYPDEVVNLEQMYADYLLNEQNNAAEAVNHYIEAGKSDKALEAAIIAHQFDRAAEIASILDNVPSHIGRKIADHYISRNELESALEILLNSGSIRDAVMLLNSKGQYARAFKIAKTLLDNNEAKEMYEEIAKNHERDGQYKDAEKIYLACGDVDSAISMYKNSKQYDSMIKLVKQYHPTLVPETCIYLAKELENDRLYKQAENYFIMAENWEQAVLMYKSADLWEDAYRVSRANGGSLAAKQVAFAWSQTLPTPSDAVAMLNRFGLLNQVVDYALESQHFDFALSLILASGNELKHKLIDVRLKYALWLEKEGRLNEAEQMFFDAQKPKEAVVMYLHLKHFDDALRVAETYLNNDEEIAKDVLTAHAKYLFDSRDLSNLTKVESLLLRAGRIEIAVRLYKDQNLWNDALRVCEQYAPHLIDSIKREMVAAGHELEPEISLQQSGRDSQLSNSSSVEAPNTADLYSALKSAEQNDDKESIVRYTLLLASQLLRDRMTIESLKLLHKHQQVYLLGDSKKLLSRIAVLLLSEVEDFTWIGTEAEMLEKRPEIYGILRDCFLICLNNNTSLSSVEKEQFEKFMLISHYLTLKTILENLLQNSSKSVLRDLHLKICVSLLRYSDLIRADKAFYEAGISARSANRLDMAFVFLNHFLDLLDAIEERDVNVDHTDFVRTDIPHQVPLPMEAAYDDKTVEEVKSWILQVSMDNQLSQSLPLDPLREGEVYEASLLNSDGTYCLPCLVTGYPVIKHRQIELKPNKFASNKEDWNKLLMLTKQTNDPDLRNILHFIGQLCGNAALMFINYLDYCPRTLHHFYRVEDCHLFGNSCHAAVTIDQVCIECTNQPVVNKSPIVMPEILYDSLIKRLNERSRVFWKKADLNSF